MTTWILWTTLLREKKSFKLKGGVRAKALQTSAIHQGLIESRQSKAVLKKYASVAPLPLLTFEELLKHSILSVSMSNFN